MSEQYLTEKEITELEAKTVQLREAIENSKKNANDHHAHGVLLLTLGELRIILEKIEGAP